MMKWVGESMKAKGKAGKQIACAAMRKLLCIAYGVLKSGQPRYCEVSFKTVSTGLSRPSASYELGLVGWALAHADCRWRAEADRRPALPTPLQLMSRSQSACHAVLDSRAFDLW